MLERGFSIGEAPKPGLSAMWTWNWWEREMARGCQTAEVQGVPWMKMRGGEEGEPSVVCAIEKECEDDS